MMEDNFAMPRPYMPGQANTEIVCLTCGAKYDAQPIYCKCGWPTLTEVNGPDVGADGDFFQESRSN